VKRLLLLVLATLAWAAALAQGVLPVPELTARVIDQTGALDAVQRQGLEDKLAAFEKESGTQIVMLLVPTTQPEDIVSYANRVANAWKIGRREVGDGVLVVVARNDRRLRIEVAKTLEGAIPDLAARQVIETAITPRFRQDDYAGGLQAAADQLIARIKGEALPAPEQRDPRSASGGAGFALFDFAILLLFAVPVVGTVLRSMFGAKLGPLVAGGGAGALAFFITTSAVVAALAGVIALVIALFSGGGGGGLARRRARGSHWGGGPFIVGGGGWGGGGGGGWGGGGGFSSGGGGDFGGGGASGDW
jgi:uncharacterized protein